MLVNRSKISQADKKLTKLLDHYSSYWEKVSRPQRLQPEIIEIPHIYIGEKKLMEILGITRQTVHNWKTKKLIKPLKLHETLFQYQEDIPPEELKENYYELSSLCYMLEAECKDISLKDYTY